MSSVKNLNVGIVGHGFVGKATDHGFDTPLVNKYIVDPNYGTSVQSMFESGFNPDVVFVAVPTPMGEDGTINSSIIESVFVDLAKFYKNETIVVIKSTITPAVVQKLEKIYDNVVYNPEFLTERNANHDFTHADMLILGGRHPKTLDIVEFMYSQYSRCEPCPVFKVDLEAASLIKYTLNCFMATKVLFFNQINDIYLNSGTSTSWDKFIDIIKADTRMGKSHMNVPGPDGRRGYGGACFPKDTAALIRYSNDINAPFTTLEEVAKANQKIRSQYADLDQREKEQNVKFNVI